MSTVLLRFLGAWGVRAEESMHLRKKSGGRRLGGSSGVFLGAKP